jgi:hypothetical protein
VAIYRSLRKTGAPCRARPCDLLVRSQRKGDNRGQRGAAAPDFIDVPSYPPRPPRAATDCQSCVSQLSAGIVVGTNQHPTHGLHFSASRFRRSHSRLPVPRPSVPVRHGHDQDAVRFDAVDDAEWKAPEQVSPRVVIEPRPCVRKASDGRFGGIHLIAEDRGGRGASFRIPNALRPPPLRAPPRGIQSRGPRPAAA